MMSLLPVLPLLVVAACGPEAHDLPPTGIYQREVMTLENGCDPVLNESTWGGESFIEVAPDRIKVPVTTYLGSGNIAAVEVTPTFLDPEDGRYLNKAEWFDSEVTGCRRRTLIEVEVLDERSLRTTITEEWFDLAGCQIDGVPPEGCTVRRQYDDTLVEACEDCDPLR